MHHTGRYSKYIRPISILLDLLVVNALSLYFFRELRVDFLVYIPYQILAWSLIALLVRFYEVYRFTTPVEIISKLFKQSTLFLLLVIAFFPFAKTTIFSGKAIAWLLSVSFVIITGFKYFFFYYLKKYRLLTHNNYRSAVIIGYTPEALNLKKVFETRQDYGYRFHGFFSDKKQGPEIV